MAGSAALQHRQARLVHHAGGDHQPGSRCWGYILTADMGTITFVDEAYSQNVCEGATIMFDYASS